MSISDFPSQHWLAYIPGLNFIHAVYAVTHRTKLQEKVESVGLKSIHQSKPKSFVYYIIVATPIAGNLAAVVYDLFLKIKERGGTSKSTHAPSKEPELPPMDSQQKILMEEILEELYPKEDHSENILMLLDKKTAEKFLENYEKTAMANVARRTRVKKYVKDLKNYFARNPTPLPQKREIASVLADQFLIEGNHWVLDYEKFDFIPTFTGQSKLKKQDPDYIIEKKIFDEMGKMKLLPGDIIVELPRAYALLRTMVERYPDDWIKIGNFVQKWSNKSAYSEYKRDDAMKGAAEMIYSQIAEAVDTEDSFESVKNYIEGLELIAHFASDFVESLKDNTYSDRVEIAQGFRQAFPNGTRGVVFPRQEAGEYVFDPNSKESRTQMVLDPLIPPCFNIEDVYFPQHSLEENVLIFKKLNVLAEIFDQPALIKSRVGRKARIYWERLELIKAVPDNQRVAFIQAMEIRSVRTEHRRELIWRFITEVGDQVDFTKLLNQVKTASERNINAFFMVQDLIPEKDISKFLTGIDLDLMPSEYTAAFLQRLKEKGEMEGDPENYSVVDGLLEIQKWMGSNSEMKRAIAMGGNISWVEQVFPLLEGIPPVDFSKVLNSIADVVYINNREATDQLVEQLRRQTTDERSEFLSKMKEYPDFKEMGIIPHGWFEKVKEVVKEHYPQIDPKIRMNMEVALHLLPLALRENYQKVVMEGVLQQWKGSRNLPLIINGRDAGFRSSPQTYYQLLQHYLQDNQYIRSPEHFKNLLPHCSETEEEKILERFSFYAQYTQGCSPNQVQRHIFALDALIGKENEHAEDWKALLPLIPENDRAKLFVGEGSVSNRVFFTRFNDEPELAKIIIDHIGSLPPDERISRYLLLRETDYRNVIFALLPCVEEDSQRVVANRNPIDLLHISEAIFGKETDDKPHPLPLFDPTVDFIVREQILQLDKEHTPDFMTALKQSFQRWRMAKEYPERIDERVPEDIQVVLHSLRMKHLQERPLMPSEKAKFNQVLSPDLADIVIRINEDLYGQLDGDFLIPEVFDIKMEHIQHELASLELDLSLIEKYKPRQILDWVKDLDEKSRNEINNNKSSVGFYGGGEGLTSLEDIIDSIEKRKERIGAPGNVNARERYYEYLEHTIANIIEHSPPNRRLEYLMYMSNAGKECPAAWTRASALFWREVNPKRIEGEGILEEDLHVILSDIREDFLKSVLPPDLELTEPHEYNFALGEIGRKYNMPNNKYLFDTGYDYFINHTRRYEESFLKTYNAANIVTALLERLESTDKSPSSNQKVGFDKDILVEWMKDNIPEGWTPEAESPDFSRENMERVKGELQEIDKKVLLDRGVLQKVYDSLSDTVSEEKLNDLEQLKVLKLELDNKLLNLKRALGEDGITADRIQELNKEFSEVKENLGKVEEEIIEKILQASGKESVKDLVQPFGLLSLRKEIVSKLLENKANLQTSFAEVAIKIEKYGSKETKDLVLRLNEELKSRQQEIVDERKTFLKEKDELQAKSEEQVEASKGRIEELTEKINDLTFKYNSVEKDVVREALLQFIKDDWSEFGSIIINDRKLADLSMRPGLLEASKTLRRFKDFEEGLRTLMTNMDLAPAYTPEGIEKSFAEGPKNFRKEAFLREVVYEKEPVRNKVEKDGETFDEDAHGRRVYLDNQKNLEYVQGEGDEKIYLRKRGQIRRTAMTYFLRAMGIFEWEHSETRLAQFCREEREDFAALE